MSRRVVITGMSGITSLGNNWKTIKNNMMQKKTGIKTMDAWKEIKGLNTALGGPIEDFETPPHYTRKQMRGMGRVSKLATVVTEEALKDANLIDQQELLTDGRTGIAYGSCSGSTMAFCELLPVFTEKSTEKITATTYIKAMSHTCAVNLGIFFGATGRVIPTSSACTSGSQAVGYAYEAIKHGYQEIMIAGGAEELCPSQVAIFDTLYATSQRNDEPNKTPRPFDRDRDGLVLGEGSCTLILEELSHAQSRGATIYAEIIGFGTNCDARHVTNPTAEMMQKALALAIKNAGVQPNEIGYVSAHGTATVNGDIAESTATNAILGAQIPVSSLKIYFGHTLGACGAMETWLGIEMMNENLFMPTINLDNVDSNCGKLDYIKDSAREIHCDIIMNNNFAFGGINTSLILKKWNP